MGIVLTAFDDVLEDFSCHLIGTAFREWLKRSPNFPTPSDIYKICKRLRKEELYRIDQEESQKMMRGEN